MKLFVRICPALILLAILLAGEPLARAGRKDADMDFSGASASASPTPTPPRFDVPIPIGTDALVVTIPYRDPRGKLQNAILTTKAHRMDLNHLALEDAYMQTYDDKGAPDAKIYMISSVLDLNTRIVTSDVPPIYVWRSDFFIVGQKMTFNTQNHLGRMSGHVHMVIYNHQDISGSSPSPSPAADPSPAGSTPQPGATP